MKRSERSVTIILLLVTVGMLVAVSVSGFAADDLTGDEILVKVDEQSEIVTRGEILSTLTFENVNPDGTTSSYKFGALARKKDGEPNITLVYYLQPKFVKGSIFLSVENEDGTTDMWLFLPALGQAKQLSTSKKESSFAGSTLSFEEIGSWTMSKEYTGQIVGETTMEVGDKNVPAYKLELTAKEGADPQFPEETIWVGKDNWILLKSKNFNSDGDLVKKMEVKELTTFEGNTVTRQLVTENVDTGASTTVTYIDRERPEQDIPDSVFDSGNLSTFDPKKWGLAE